VRLIEPMTRDGLIETAFIKASCVLLVALVMVACNDAAAPPIGPAIRIVPVADSVFEGDTVRLTAQVLDEAGAVVPAAPVTWTVSDRRLAEVVGDGAIALLRPGTVRITARSGALSVTYDLGIGRLVVKRVVLTPGSISMGRTDRLPLAANVMGQGDRPIAGRVVAFISDDTLVAIVPGPATIGSTDTALLIAVGSGSTTIRASVDGVTGTAQVGVVVIDTILTLTEYNDSPLPVLVAADSVEFDGVKEFDEAYVDTGTLVLSGLLQKRYQLEVRVSQYRVIQTGDTVERELRFRMLGEHDLGLVTVDANGNVTMLSEFIGPHLEHTATLQLDGYLVHYRVPGTDMFLDLRFELLTP